MTSEAAFAEASAYCIEHDILKEILSTERNLVMQSILTEFNERQYKKNLLQEGFSHEYALFSLAELSEAQLTVLQSK